MKSLLFCLAVAVLLWGVTPAWAAKSPAVNKDMLLKDESTWLKVQRPLTETDLDHRFVLLDFWTYGCINCMQIVPDLDYLEQKFGDRLLVIGVHSAKFSGEKGDARILAAAERFKLNHPVINDSDYEIWKYFEVRAWPTQVLLDHEGMEIGRYVGEGHRAGIEADIEEHLINLEGTPQPVPVSDFLAKAEDTSTLLFPARLAYADEQQTFFVVDSGHNRILGFDKSGKITVTIGSGMEGAADGAFDAAQFNNPRGLTVVDDILYVADTNNHMIRKVDLDAGTVSRIAGTGMRGYNRTAQKAVALETAIASPWDVELIDRDRLAIAAAGTHQLWYYDLNDKTLSVLAGSGGEDVIDSATALKAELAQPSGLSVVDGNLFFADAESSALRVLSRDGSVKTLVGTGLFDFGHIDGKYPEAMLQHPQGLYATADRIYVADTYNDSIRIYDHRTDLLSTMTLPENMLNEPGDVLLVDDAIYIVDTNNHRILYRPHDIKAFQPLKLQE